ncbi:SCO family protein [Lunatibacter salilacus]|uniref:SCO family protein n=1 Tax=Lunatibacter salilacus TaxID=2483804 RepID=UPI00131CBA59|nr:SCO family protein [Lunatibacter salilacus]
MKLFLSIPLLIFIFSCNENNISKEIVIEDDTMHEMSIYQLPSVWNTQDGKQIEFKDLKGETLAVVMIYTACRTACPRLVADMRSIETAVSTEKTGGVKYVLVSIDPVADSPERLKAFAKENGMDGPEWLFLQGTEDGVRDFANILAVKYKKISPIDFSHSNIISVFDRQGVMTYQKEGLGLENQDVVNEIIETAKR